MKTFVLLIAAVMLLVACGGGATTNSATDGPNSSKGNVAAFDAPPTPGGK